MDQDIEEWAIFQEKYILEGILKLFLKCSNTAGRGGGLEAT